MAIMASSAEADDGTTSAPVVVDDKCIGDDKCKSNGQFKFSRSDLAVKVCVLASLFWLSSCLLYFLFSAHPDVEPEFAKRFWLAVPNSCSYSELSKIKDVENVKAVFNILYLYKDTHQLYIISILGSVYLFSQAFPLFMLWLPGTASAISLIVGALFGFCKGFAICVILANLGPLLAYSLSAYTGKPIVATLFPSKLDGLRRQVDSHGSNLLGFLIFLRVSPFPNFLINMASPVVGVPLRSFMLATFIGLLPNTLALVSMGVTLKELTSLNSGMGMMGLIGVLAFAAVLPGIFKKRFGGSKEE